MISWSYQKLLRQRTSGSWVNVLLLNWTEISCGNSHKWKQFETSITTCKFQMVISGFVVYNFTETNYNSKAEKMQKGSKAICFHQQLTFRFTGLSCSPLVVNYPKL